MSTGLQQAVAINESIKDVRGHCRQISLMGLNALILAQGVGQDAKGFAVMANEVRQLSIRLGKQMDLLHHLSITMLKLDSITSRGERRRMVFDRTAQLRATGNYLDKLQARLQQAGAAAQKEAVRLRSELGSTLDTALQAAMYGIAIARQARIESAYSHSHAAQLGAVSDDFRREIDAILPRLDELQKMLEHKT
ncbi:hypothetical protein [Parachitinimonas caeni]|uniref:Methyl-accepting transducer domain-containing protein n=1 Tax=Parachitinimonas caeni TaxID=3031301 RepID=A0ABT7E3N0_9NEIS|nr:hypothetical protein [Parachitinimonas caeni]MDK2126654.1 hypothetical protein [Parachitinimonas caeni]